MYLLELDSKPCCGVFSRFEDRSQDRKGGIEFGTESNKDVHGTVNWEEKSFLI
jgi:hypothetical protein